jgi:hypothetical protein
MVRSHAAECASERTVATARALHSESFAHNRAAATKDLQIRHATSAGRDIVASGRGRERAESGGGGFFKERALFQRLGKNGLHSGTDGGGRVVLCGEQSEYLGGIAEKADGGGWMILECGRQIEARSMRSQTSRNTGVGVI